MGAGAAITLFVRPGTQETDDALRFLKAERYGADKVRDLAKDPPTGDEWAMLRKAFGGSLRPLVDGKHPDAGRLAPEPMDDATLGVVLASHPNLLKAPILVTPKGGVAGFREQRWRSFLDIGKGSRGGL